MVSTIKHLRCWQEYEKMVSLKNRSWLTFTHVYYGPPGTGKTRRARYEAEAKYGAENVFWLPPPEGGRIWWDGYTGQPAVVIDEYYGSYMPQTLLQRICDRYPIRVPTKGSTTPMLAKELWITSNIEPVAWYKKGLGPLARRLSGEMGVMEHMHSEWVPPDPVVQQLVEQLIPQEPQPQPVVQAEAASPALPSLDSDEMEELSDRAKEAFLRPGVWDRERQEECELLDYWREEAQLEEAVSLAYAGDEERPPKRRRLLSRRLRSDEKLDFSEDLEDDDENGEWLTTRSSEEGDATEQEFETDTEEFQ